MTLKSSVEAIAFTRVTALAERMKVAEVITATQRQRDDMVNGQVLGSAALLALVTIRAQKHRHEPLPVCEFAGSFAVSSG